MTRDLRKYASQTKFQLIIGALVLLFIVGDGLIFIIYGPSAGLMGVACLLVGMIPVILILLVLALVNWIAKRANRD